MYSFVIGTLGGAEIWETVGTRDFSSNLASCVHLFLSASSSCIFFFAMNDDIFKTPKSKRPQLQQFLQGGAVDSPGRQIVVPSSPYLERLGYGTGSIVFVYNFV